MKYYEQLMEQRVFDYKDLSEIISENQNTISSLLRDYIRKHYIEQIRKGLYVVVSMETGAPAANKFEIGSHILEGGYISHHSAFEYFGLTNQMMFTVQVSGKGRFRPFSFDGYEYQSFRERIKEGVLQRENGIRVTDVERTVLDSINDLEKVGGLAELCQCLQMIPFLDEEKLLWYMEQYGKQFLYQKAGFLLEHLKTDLKLSDCFFNKCREYMGKSKRYFSDTMDRKVLKYSPTWQLYVPKDFMRMAELEE